MPKSFRGLFSNVGLRIVPYLDWTAHERRIDERRVCAHRNKTSLCTQLGLLERIGTYLGADRIRKLLKRNGGQGRNRTADAGLFRAALYQLSYLARLERPRSVVAEPQHCQLINLSEFL